MFDWLNKKAMFHGSVLFPGTIAPPINGFSFLRKKEISVRQRSGESDAQWAMDLSHPEWGEAIMICPKSRDPVYKEIVDWVPNLTEREKQNVKRAGYEITLTLLGKKNNVLRDRKSALHFLDAIMGSDGLAAVDYVAQCIWSPEALKEEVSHDADLDVDHIIAYHSIYENEEDKNVYWLHSHGLSEIGFFDFDILNPSSDMIDRGSDLLRAIAFSILEKKINISDTINLFSPGGKIHFVDVSEFNRYASAPLLDLRGGPEEEFHNKRRVVLCNPTDGWISRWSKKMIPSKSLSQELPDNPMFYFSHDASCLMSERAKITYPVFCKHYQEFREFEFPTLIKLGYRVDGGGERDLEHLWFCVHELFDDEIDATLINQPVNVSYLVCDQRQRHKIDNISDWTIFTPEGPINPRESTAARILREAQV